MNTQTSSERLVDLHLDECEAGGKDAKVVAALARKLAKISDELCRNGLYVFGGSGTGSIRCNDGGKRPLVLAHFGQGFDGGDGATNEDSDGLLRGE